MSFTRVVPAVVPSLFHNSEPAAVTAVKNNVPFTFVRLLGLELLGVEPLLPVKISLTRTVPAAVPSLFHNSWPVVPSLAEKNRVPLTFVMYLRSVKPLTKVVPVSVPSLFQSPTLAPSVAAKKIVPMRFVSELGVELLGVYQ